MSDFLHFDPSAARLRLSVPADQPFHDRLFAACHAHEFAPLGLPEDELEGLLSMQARAQRESYRRDFPTALDHLVLDTAGAPIGRVLVEHHPAHLHLVDIALLPEVQHRGLGARLLEDLQAEATRAGASIQLEVRPGNPALRLYRRLGFRIAAAAAGGLTMRWSSGTEGAGVSEPETAPEAHVLFAGWQPRVGMSFVVCADDGPIHAADEPATLRLERVDRLSATSFCLHFSGPATWVLAQGTYTLASGRNDQAPEILFLVPTGPEDGRMRYEAVFG